MTLKTKAISLILSLTVAASSCVSVAVKSSNRTPDGQKIEKILVVSETEGQFEDYFSKTAQQLAKSLEKKGLGTSFFVFRDSASADEAAAYRKLLGEFGPCHVLALRRAAIRENRDETHLKEEALLRITLQHSSTPKVLWQSTLDVSGGGVLGFGTMEAGAGGKLTAEKIVRQLQQDGILAQDQ
jgi:hypothetical protein